MTGARQLGRGRLLGVGAVAFAAAVSAGGAGGASTQVVRPQPVIGNDTPSWSPDGRRIAFTSFRNGYGDIYAIGIDGRGERRLTTSPAHDDHPAWSPDGNTIAFVSNRNGNPELYLMNADGSNQRRLTRNPARDYYPSWSPDGRRIAFQSDRDGRPQIYRIDADGTGEERLTSGLASNGRPAWSAAGEIAFSSNRDGTFRLFVMDDAGAGQRRLAAVGVRASEAEPSWSPDGSRIALVALGDIPIGNTEIYSAASDGTSVRRLTSYWGRDVSPTWSPDGRSIAFTRGPSAFRPEVWIMAADGSGARQLTSTATRFQFVRVRRTPTRPAAGRRFTVRAVVSEPTGDPVERGTITCRARVGARPLRPALRRFAGSEATCGWNVPTGARGQTITVGFDVRSGRSSGSYTLRLVVR